MAKKGSFSKVYDKNGDYADVEAVRFDGSRTFQIQGDVTASQTWNGDPSSPLTLNASIGAKKVTQDKIGDKAVGAGQMADGSVGLTQMDPNAMNGTVQDNDHKLATHAAVKTYVDSQISGQGTYLGKHTVAEINAFVTDNLHNGDRVMVSDSGTINLGPGGVGFDVIAGEDLILYKSGSTVQWDTMDGNFKTKQNAVSKAGSTTKTITAFSQNANGDADVTYEEIQRASTSQEGLVQLTDSHTSTSTTTAATPKNVKEAYDLANGKYSKPSGGIPKSDLASGVQTSLDKADSALQGVKLAGASSALTPDANKVVTVPNAVPTGTGETNGLMTAADKAKLDGIASGANKVEDSNTNGNIKIDGTETNVYTHPSAGPSSTTSVGDTTNQTPAFGGTFKAISQTVNKDGHTTATSEHTVTLPTDGKDLTSTVATIDNYTNPGSTATALKTLFGKIWNFIGRLRTSWQTAPDDTHFPSEKLVKDSLDTKADNYNTVAICDGYAQGNVGKWYKIADTVVNGKNCDVTASFSIVTAHYASHGYYGKLMFSFRHDMSGRPPMRFVELESSRGNTEKVQVYVVTRGAVTGDVTYEIWVSNPLDAKTYVFIRLLQSAIKVNPAKNLWNFYADATASDTAPQNDSSTNVYSYAASETTWVQSVKINNGTELKTGYGSVNIPLATTSADGAMSAADKNKLNGIEAGAEANVQSDWDETSSSSDAFIKNKPFYSKSIGGTAVTFRVCIFPLSGSSSTSSGSAIDVQFRYGNGSVFGKLAYKNGFSLILTRISELATTRYFKFYYVVGDVVEIFAQATAAYVDIKVAPSMNMPKNSVNFTNFGMEVDSLPEGATEITPVWVANSANSSGTAPVKVDAYGALTPVPMDSTPTASSTSLMTSGDIKTALDRKASALDGERYNTFYGFVIKKSLSSSWYNGNVMTVKMGYGGSNKRYEFGFRLPGGTSDEPIGSGGFCRYTVHGDDGYEIDFSLYTKVTDGYLEVMVVGIIGTGCILEYGIGFDKDKITVLTDNPSTEGWTSRAWDYVRHFQIPPVTDVAYVANQSGGGGNLNKTINGTTTSVLAFMNDSEAVAIWADAKTAAANAS